MEKIIFKGHEAKRYVDAVLFYFAICDADQVKRKDMMQALKNGAIEFTNNQINSAVGNFKRLKLISKGDPGMYSLNRQALIDFTNRYIDGKTYIWAPKPNQKSTRKGGRARGHADSTSLVTRAIFAAFNKVMSLQEIAEHAQKELGLDRYSHKSAQNFIYNNSELFNAYPSGNRFKLYGPRPEFFSSYKKEMLAYIRFFPNKEKQIKARFNGVPTAEKSHDDELPLPVKKAEIVMAILAAYRKPLTLKNITRLAERNGHDISVNYLHWFKNNHVEMLTVTDKGYRSKFYSANPAFFRDNVASIEKFVEILPDKKTQIYEAFNMHEPEQAKAHEKAHADDFDKQPTATETTPADMHESTDALEQEVSAADVGASIIAYVVKLKEALHKKRNEETIARDEKEHVKSLNSRIMGLTNERNGLLTENDKIKAICTSKENRIRELTAQVSKLTAQVATLEEKLSRATAGKSKFNMQEVAKITTLVKRPKKPDTITIPVMGQSA